MKCVVGFVDGSREKFDISSFEFGEFDNVLKLKKDGKLVGLISANQMTYWFCEEEKDEL